MIIFFLKLMKTIYLLQLIIKLINYLIDLSLDQFHDVVDIMEWVRVAPAVAV